MVLLALLRTLTGLQTPISVHSASAACCSALARHLASVVGKRNQASWVSLEIGKRLLNTSKYCSTVSEESHFLLVHPTFPYTGCSVCGMQCDIVTIVFCMRLRLQQTCQQRSLPRHATEKKLISLNVILCRLRPNWCLALEES